MNGYFAQLSLWPDFREADTDGAVVHRIGRKDGIVPFDLETYHTVPLVLASSSPSKCAILRALGLRVLIDPADIVEEVKPGDEPETVVRSLAEQKGRVVARRHPEALVIGTDTIVYADGAPIGKPRDREHARNILRRFSGTTHSILTGLVVVEQKTLRQSLHVCRTDVTFRQLSPQTIERYVSTEEPMGKAGAYALQGTGALLVERIEGEYSNVLGLPIPTLVTALGDLGYELI